MKRFKLIVKQIKELTKTPRGKAIVFFAAYLMFFVFLGIVVRVSSSSASNEPSETNDLQFNLNSILNSNYKFNYQITIDGSSDIYNGSSTENNSLFIKNNAYTYYYNGNNYFSNINGVWISVANPYSYYGFINASNISNFIKNATYVSKTEYDSGKNVYNYVISSATLSNIIDGILVDIEEIPNELIVVTDSDGNVNEIKYMLNSYCKVKGICFNEMNVVLKYEDFGNVTGINNPLE